MMIIVTALKGVTSHIHLLVHIYWLVGLQKFACNNNRNNNRMSVDGRNHDGSMTYVLFTSRVKRWYRRLPKQC
jgi:hypothetical protein